MLALVVCKRKSITPVSHVVPTYVPTHEINRQADYVVFFSFAPFGITSVFSDFRLIFAFPL